MHSTTNSAEQVSGEKNVGELGQDSWVRAVLEAAVDGFVVIDDRGTMIAANAAVERMFGYASGGVVGLNINILMPSPYHENHGQYLADYRATGQKKIIGIGREVTGKRKDGSTFPVRLSVAEHKTGAGPSMYVGTLSDLSERDASAARFKAVFDAVPCALLVVDRTGTIKLANAEAARLFRSRREELVDSVVEQLVPELLRGSHHGFMSTYFENPQCRSMGEGRELYSVRCDGTEFPVEIGLNPIIYEEEQVVLASILDVTFRKRAEAEMLAGQERVRAIVETAVDSIITIDERGTIETFNQAAEQMFGYSSQEVVGCNVSMLMPSPHRDEHDQYLRRYKDTGERRVIGIGREAVGQRKNGTLFPMELAVGEMNIGGRRMFSGIVRDISERKNSERIQRRYTQQLESANQKAQAATKAKSEFLANMSHELRTPMNSVIGFTNRLKKRLAETLNPRDKDALDTIDRNGKHLLSLINDVLDGSKIEAGMMELCRSEFDFVGAVKEVLAQTSSLLDQKPIELEAKFPDAAVTINGDPVRVRQIITNLVSNAIKYTDRGNIFVTVAEERDARLGHVARLTVRDTGIGIKEEDKRRLFQKFEQLNSSISRRSGGTGLGLSIVRSFVELHSGAVEVASEFGKGSTFSVVLPLLPVAPESSREESMQDRSTYSECDGMVILCLCDNVEHFSTVKRSLEKNGFQVLATQESETAVEKAKTNRPDLAILDLCHCGSSDWELLGQFHTDPDLCDIPIVLYSGYIAERADDGAQISGGLAKPVGLKDQADAVRGALTCSIEDALIITQNADLAKQAVHDLEKCGIRAEVVVDGIEAIYYLKHATPSAVLLDLTMANRSGYAILKDIRGNKEWATIPVITLPAKLPKSSEAHNPDRQTDAMHGKESGGLIRVIDLVLNAIARRPRVVEATR